MQAMLQGEACTELPVSCTEMLASTVFLPAESTLIKELLESYFSQYEWDFPFQSEQSYFLISIFTDQSEQLHSD